MQKNIHRRAFALVLLAMLIFELFAFGCLTVLHFQSATPQKVSIRPMRQGTPRPEHQQKEERAAASSLRGTQGTSELPSEMLTARGGSPGT